MILAQLSVGPGLLTCLRGNKCIGNGSSHTKEGLYQRGIISILNVICLLSLAVAITPAKKKDKETKRVEAAIQESKSAAELIDKFMTSSDKAIPKEILDKAKAVAYHRPAG